MGTFECSVKHEMAASLVRDGKTVSSATLVRRPTDDFVTESDCSTPLFEGRESKEREVELHGRGACTMTESQRGHPHQQQHQPPRQELQRRLHSFRTKHNSFHENGPTLGMEQSGETRVGTGRASQFAAAFQVEITTSNGFERPNLPVAPPTPSQTSCARALCASAMALPSSALPTPLHQGSSSASSAIATIRPKTALTRGGIDSVPTERGAIQRSFHGTMNSTTAVSSERHQGCTAGNAESICPGGSIRHVEGPPSHSASAMDPNAPLFSATNPLTPSSFASAGGAMPSPGTMAFPLSSPMSTLSTPTSATTNYSSLTAIQGPVSPSRKKNSTPLHYACRFGHIQVVQTILESGLKNGGEELARIEADLIAADWKQMTPVHVAAKHGQDAVVALLVGFAEHRASMFVTLNSAASAEANAHARRWLRAVLDAQCGEGATALMLAAQHGHASCVRHLLSVRYGVDPTRRTLTRGWTAATFAARYGHAGVLCELIKVTDVRGCLGMQITPNDACCWDASDVLDTPDAQDGNTPLMIAAKYGKVDSVRQLLSAAAWPRGMNPRPAINVHAANVIGQTAVHLAAQHGHNEVVGELLRFLPTAANTVPGSASAATASSSSSSSTSSSSRTLLVPADVAPDQLTKTESTGSRMRQALPPLEIPDPGGSACASHLFASMNTQPVEARCTDPRGLAAGSNQGCSSSVDGRALPSPVMGAFAAYPQAGWSVWGAASISPLSPSGTVQPVVATASMQGDGGSSHRPSNSFPCANDNNGPMVNNGSPALSGAQVNTPSGRTGSSTPSSISSLLNGQEQDGAFALGQAAQRESQTALLAAPQTQQSGGRAAPEPRWDAWINDLVGE
jgi:ankyrin repeat protein